MKKCKIVIKESKYDSTEDTLKHKDRVNELMEFVAEEFLKRGEEHDNSKLEAIEKETFDEFTPLLKDATYGSEEYNQFLKDMKPALDNHYANNNHHPEAYENGINGMNLFDVVEMFFDWKASSERHGDGDLNKSLELNTDRFKMNEQLVDIFKNTIEFIGDE